MIFSKTYLCALLLLAISLCTIPGSQCAPNLPSSGLDLSSVLSTVCKVGCGTNITALLPQLSAVVGLIPPECFATQAGKNFTVIKEKVETIGLKFMMAKLLNSSPDLSQFQNQMTEISNELLPVAQELAKCITQAKIKEKTLQGLNLLSGNVPKEYQAVLDPIWALIASRVSQQALG